MNKQWKQLKGLTIAYVGDGKGKTTAAVGVATRALGWGWKVYFMQFMKEEKWPSGERAFFRLLKKVGSAGAVPPATRSDVGEAEPYSAGDTPPTSPRRGGASVGLPPPASGSVPSTSPLSSAEGQAPASPSLSLTPLGGKTPDRDDIFSNPLLVACPDRSVGGEGEGEVPRIDVEVVGEGFVGIMGDKKERQTHKNAAAKGLARAREVMTSRKYQLVILDEILSAVDEGLLTEQEIGTLLDAKPVEATLVMTGHKSYPELFERVDLVTEMRKVKHPFDDGYIAKQGIDY